MKQLDYDCCIKERQLVGLDVDRLMGVGRQTRKKEKVALVCNYVVEIFRSELVEGGSDVSQPVTEKMSHFWDAVSDDECTVESCSFSITLLCSKSLDKILRRKWNF